MRLGRLLLFEGTTLDVVAGLLGLAVLGALLYEIYRDGAPRQSLRALLHILAVVALVILVWNPRFQTEASPRVVLLGTPGVTPERFARLADSLKQPFLAVLPGVVSPRGMDVVRLADAGALRRAVPNMSAVHVAGTGLAPYERERLRGVRVVPHLAPLQTGITYVQWPRRIDPGGPVPVDGAVNVHPRDADRLPVTLYLDGPGGPEDSLVVRSTGRASFRLTARPPASGPVDFSLRLVSSTGIGLGEDSLPVFIDSPEPPRVLILEGAPGFETRYLKNWLAAEGGEVVVRSMISRDRYRTEFVNADERPMERITPGVLREVDLLILDGRTLRTLPEDERRYLRRAVAEDGLGVLLREVEAEGGVIQAPFFLPFRGDVASDSSRSARVKLGGEQSPSPVPLDPLVLEAAWGEQGLVFDEQNRPVVVVHFRGRGRVGLSLVRQTYRWLLEGEAPFHAAYWSTLLKALARRDTSGTWSVGTGGPLTLDEPMTLVYRGLAAEPVARVRSSVGTVEVMLAQDPDEPTQWQGVYWPRVPGWHTVWEAAASDTSRGALHLYVADRNHWSVWRASRNAAATTAIASLDENTVAGERSKASTSVPVPPGYVFGCFLLSVTALWIERKI